MREGLNPTIERKVLKNANLQGKGNTFKAVALIMMENHFNGKSHGYKDKSLRYFERYVFGWLGNLPITSVKSAHLLDCLERIQKLNLGNTIKKVEKSDCLNETLMNRIETHMDNAFTLGDCTIMSVAEH